MYDLEQIVNKIYLTPSDINEHIPTLIEYASECETITEMGVRAITSTWAFLGAAPKRLISYDMEDPSHYGSNIQIVHDVAKQYGLNFTFIKADVLKIDIEETDLLFLDTWHAYDQLKAELDIHHIKVKKYIAMHDTTTYGGPSQGDPIGLLAAVMEFLASHREWTVYYHTHSNNGLTILERT